LDSKLPGRRLSRASCEPFAAFFLRRIRPRLLTMKVASRWAWLRHRVQRPRTVSRLHPGVEQGRGRLVAIRLPGAYRVTHPAGDGPLSTSVAPLSRVERQCARIQSLDLATRGSSRRQLRFDGERLHRALHSSTTKNAGLHFIAELTVLVCWPIPPSGRIV